MTADELNARFTPVLDNFSFAGTVAHYLLELRVNGHAPPSIVVRLESALGVVVIPGTNCGFFTTPVIHQACLDVRRTLAFFNLRYGINAQEIESHRPRNHQDLWQITDLGIDAVGPGEFRSLSEEILEQPPEPFIQDMIRYTDKEIAHFTTAPHTPDLRSIIASCELMSEAIMKFVYDPLNIPRPPCRFSVGE